MRLLKIYACLVAAFGYIASPCVVKAQTGTITSLQQVLGGMQSNYELLKAQGSLVQEKQAQKKSTAYNRLPHLNTWLQANIASDNNLEGDYLYGAVPSLGSGERAKNNLSAISGDMALVGLNWEVVNFGRYKAQNDVAKSDLALQINTLAQTQYSISGIASAYYLELLREFELKRILQDNVNRLQDLKATIVDLVNSGLRPAVDSTLATAELAKSTVSLYEAQKNFTQTQVRLSILSGIASGQINPDTSAENKLITEGMAFISTSSVDSLNHPDINFYASTYDLNKARLKLENKSYYPKIFIDVQGWERGSSLSNSDHYNSDLLAGYSPSRFNYFAGLTMTYDLFNIFRKRLNAPITRFGAEAASHDLQNAKDNLKGDIDRALIERNFQLNKLNETTVELNAANLAYEQQLNLYNNGLSSIIELNAALDFSIRAQTDFIDTRIGLMKSILNYSLVTNSFNALVQNLKI